MFTNVLVKDRIVDHYKDTFSDGSSKVVPLTANYVEVY